MNVGLIHMSSEIDCQWGTVCYMILLRSLLDILIIMFIAKCIQICLSNCIIFNVVTII